MEKCRDSRGNILWIREETCGGFEWKHVVDPSGKCLWVRVETCEGTQWKHVVEIESKLRRQIGVFR